MRVWCTTAWVLLVLASGWFPGRGVDAQSSVNLAQELQDTKFQNIRCQPDTNSIVTDIQNGIVSQTDTQFLYEGSCSNQRLLFDPPNLIIAAGLKATVNGTLSPQTGITAIVGQTCALSLLAVIETVNPVTGTTVSSNQVADSLQFACGDVAVDTDCDWIDLACYWTQGDTVDSSAFWLWVCMFAYLVIIVMYYLFVRLPLATADSAKSRKQYAFLEKRQAELEQEDARQIEMMVGEVTNGDKDVGELDSQLKEIDERLNSAEVRRFQEMLDRNQDAQAAGTVGVSGVPTGSGAWTLNFSLPSSMAGVFGAPAAGRESRYASARPEMEMDTFGTTSVKMEEGPSLGTPGNSSTHPLLSRYGDRVDRKGV